MYFYFLNGTYDKRTVNTRIHVYFTCTHFNAVSIKALSFVLYLNTRETEILISISMYINIVVNIFTNKFQRRFFRFRNTFIGLRCRFSKYFTWF